MPTTKEEKPLSQQTVPIDTPEPLKEAKKNKELGSTSAVNDGKDPEGVPRYYNSETNPDGSNQGVINVQS